MIFYTPKKIRDFLLQNIWQTLFWICAGLLLILLPTMSRGHGVTWDEWETSNNGIRALRNIVTWGKDNSLAAVAFSHLYTHFFSVTVSLVYGVTHNDLSRLLREGLQNETQIFNFFSVSHFINSLFGFIAALYAGLFAKKISGWRAAFLTLFFVGLSPRFFGHAMNNSKDIPFAATYMFCIYYMSAFLEALPRIHFRHALLTAAGIGLCLASRLGGIILVFYFCTLTFIIILKLKLASNLSLREGLNVGVASGAILTVAAAICLLFWPYGRSQSITSILDAFLKTSNFEAWNYLVLFEGKMTMSVDLPWYYIPKWVLISSPLFFPAGLILFAFLCRAQNEPPVSWRLYSTLILSASFPVLFVIIRDSNVYDSWRHLLFIYPPLVIFSAIGWDRLNALKVSNLKRIAAGILLALVCIEPLLWMVKNPRNLGTYFNPLAGGIRGAFTRYESDYWGNCLRESAEWLAQYHKENYADFPFAIVWSEGTVMQTYPFLKKELGTYYRPFGYPDDFLKNNPYVLYVFGKELRKNLPWNYAILMSRQRTPDELKSAWPPPGTIHTVKADGVPLCAVVKNEEFYRHLANVRAASQSMPSNQT